MADPRLSQRQGLLRSIAVSLRNIPKTYRTLSSIEFLFWFATGASSYLTVFLQRAGYTPPQVGFINAVNALTAICALPFWGMMADKFRSVRKIYLVCIIAAGISWALIPWSSKIAFGPVALIQIIIPLGAVFRMPANSLIDAYVVQSAARERLQYGQIRFCGSLSFAVMCVILSAVLPRAGVDISFYIYGVAFIPLIYITLREKDNRGPGVSGADKNASFTKLKIGRLFKNYYFVTYLIFAVFLFMPANASGAFLPYLVESVGGNTAQFGLIAGYKALLEIPSLLLMKLIMRRFSLAYIILSACVFYILEAALYTRAGSLTQILLIQTFQGLGGGLMIGAASNYVFCMAPEGLKSTSQTINGAISATAGILGNIAGGNLIGLIGIRQYYLVNAAIISFALVYFSSTLIFGVKKLKISVPKFSE